jgi:cell wall assembly regulator SMI1
MPGIITAMAAEVIHAWNRIVTVLVEHAPATARCISGPASDEALTALQGEIGQPLPDDLLEWLRAADGAGLTFDAEIIPHFLPYGVDAILSDQKVRSEVYGTSDHSAGWIAGGSAGDEYDGGWPAEFASLIPLATSGAGDILVVDLRPGPLRGCVMEWYNHGGLTARWPSITAMLTDIADTLEHGRPEDRDPTDDECAHRTRTGGQMAVFTADGTVAWEDWESDWS